MSEENINRFINNLTKEGRFPWENEELIQF